MKTTSIKLLLLASTTSTTVVGKKPYVLTSCSPPEFTLTLQYQADNLTLGAIDSGVDGMLNVVAFDPASFTGTPGQSVHPLFKTR